MASMENDIASEPPRSNTSRSGGGAGRRLLLLALGLLAALAIGGAASLWGASQAGLISWRGWRAAPPPRAAPQRVATPMPVASPTPVDQQAQVALAMRIGELEQRISRLDLETEAAADNAARAEGLMIAFAARRAIERGVALGYLENQLKLRFGDGQPNAVAMLIEAGARPVTREQLGQRLNALAPRLAEPPPGEGTWERVQREIAGLFVVRKASASSPLPQRRLERARQAVAGGQVDVAMAEVERLPGKPAASEWLTMAQRYVMAQRSLDLIETAALMEPRRQDEPAPASSPAPAPEPTQAAEGTA